MNILIRLQQLEESLSRQQWLASLALRAYLAPVFWMAGTRKLADMENTIAWFGNAEWGLGLPLPSLLAWLAAGTEVIGAVLLVLGLAVRFIAVPLMVTMLVAAWTVHWENGWLAIAEGQGSWFASDRTLEAVERLDRAKDILREYGHYDWLTEHGSFVVLNNGVEFAVTYFVMLLALFFLGAGRFCSVDHGLAVYRTRFFKKTNSVHAT